MSRQSLLSLAYYYKNAIHWFAESLGTSASAKRSDQGTLFSRRA